MAVKVRSFWDDETFESHLRQWLACAANQGVLISPYISPREKIVRDRAIEIGGRIIQLRLDGFPELNLSFRKTWR